MNPLQTFRCLFVFSMALLAMAQQPANPPAPAPGTPRPAPSLAPPTPQQPVSSDTVVITVGNEKLTRAQFEELLAALPENVRATAAAPGRGKRQLAEQLAEVLAIAQEARKRKLDQTPSVQQIIALQTDQVLAGALARQISTELIHAYYDQHKAEFARVKASHILIRFKGSSAPARAGQKDLSDEEALAKAQDIRKKLVDGADFAATAKAESDDVGSGSKGGSLGTFGHGQMVPPFEQAAFSLPLNQISEPVKSQFGYHIINVEERTPETFEEAKPELEKQLGQKLTRDALDNIHKQAQISIDDAYFGPGSRPQVAQGPEGTVHEEVEKIRNGRYAPMPSAQRSTGNSPSGRTAMTVKNSTSYELSVYFDGPVSTKLTIVPGASQDVDLAPGTFHVAGRVTAPDVLPFYGDETYASSARYSVTFYIQ